MWVLPDILETEHALLDVIRINKQGKTKISLKVMLVVVQYLNHDLYTEVNLCHSYCLLPWAKTLTNFQ